MNADCEFESIAARLGDSQLTSAVCSALSGIYDYEALASGTADAPEEFCTVYSASSITGFLCGDGLNKLLEIESPTFYLKALETLGHSILATRFKKYLNDPLSLDDAEKRLTEQSLFREDDRIKLSTGKFIRSRFKLFSTLTPSIQTTLTYLEVFDPKGYKRKLAEPSAYVESLREMLKMLENKDDG